MCTVGFGAVAWDVPARGEVEEQQVSHQGHCQQHGLQFQAYPQEDRARNEAQDAAAGVVLKVGTISCVSHQEACLEQSAASSLLLRSSTAGHLYHPWPAASLFSRSARALHSTGVRSALVSPLLVTWTSPGLCQLSWAQPCIPLRLQLTSDAKILTAQGE